MSNLCYKHAEIPHRHGKEPIRGVVIGPRDRPAWEGAWYSDIVLAGGLGDYISKRKHEIKQEKS